ncbi:hypothetical protein Dsin_005697 [Dipteronia sinensis]|uniref:Endonuclease/exonuclease/phosphatase domain-containing protein n=1 Tax=Dipteronia sinensis TaxID=43782 RepID=A0AAE0EGQ9_9ROSI|nr:hypothetical protein Dsin_005697 [Dipteronia sinensis]
MEHLRVKLGFCCKLVVDSEGKSEGLCLLWNNNVLVDLLTYSNGHIDVKVSDKGGVCWRFTGFYGNPDRRQRHQSWILLRRLTGISRLPWLCMGDFNEVLEDVGKLGGSARNWWAMTDFREALNDCNLEDMGYVGPRFTWSNKRNGSETIMERIDRALCNESRRTMFPQFVVRHLDFWGSDHRPVVVEFTPNSQTRNYKMANRGKRFFFEECWLEEQECRDIVETVWRIPESQCNMGNVLTKIEKCGMLLKSWNLKKKVSIAKF